VASGERTAVYLMTAAALNLRPEQVMMCAAHSDDLRSAASNGLRTAHIARPGENMEDLAAQLGV